MSGSLSTCDAKAGGTDSLGGDMTFESIVVSALLLADLAVPAKTAKTLSLHGVGNALPAGG